MKKFKPLMLAACSLLFQTQTYAISNQQVNHLAQAFMQQNKVEGMSIAVINKDKVNIFNYGYADKANNIPVTSDTIYTIASFTKTFTATLAAVAAVEGKLKLDAPFIEYLTDVKNNKHLSDITTTELLAHTSSFPFNFNPPPKTYADVVHQLSQFVPQRLPGIAYGYSNAGIGTVGYVLQNAYAQKYQAILADKILSPLNMQSTYLNVPQEREKNIALGHDQNGNVVAYNRDVSAWFAAASLKSTITDMAKYLQAHVDAAKVKNEDLAKAIQIVHQNKYCFADKLSCEQLAWQAHMLAVLNNDNGDTYFVKFDANGNPIFEMKKIVPNHAFSSNKIFIDKTGSGFGMSSYMAYIPDKKMGVVILLNKDIGGNERIKLGRDILQKM